MDGEMQIDSESEGGKPASNYVFSTPISSPEKVVNAEGTADSIFGSKGTQHESSAFIFAKPTSIESSPFSFSKPLNPEASPFLPKSTVFAKSDSAMTNAEETSDPNVLSNSKLNSLFKPATTDSLSQETTSTFMSNSQYITAVENDNRNESDTTLLKSTKSRETTNLSLFVKPSMADQNLFKKSAEVAPSSNPTIETSPFSKSLQPGSSSFTSPSADSPFVKTSSNLSPFSQSSSSEPTHFTKSTLSIAHPFAKPSVSESSPFVKPTKSDTSVFANQTVTSTSPFNNSAMVIGDNNESKDDITTSKMIHATSATDTSPFAITSTNETSNQILFGKSGEAISSTKIGSVLVKPSTSESSPFIRPSTDVPLTPFAKPLLSTPSPSASPFIKPVVSNTSPFVKQTVSDSSPFTRPTNPETSPFAKPDEPETSPFINPAKSESISPFMKSSLTTSSSFKKSETSPFITPTKSETFSPTNQSETILIEDDDTSESDITPPKSIKSRLSGQSLSAKELKKSSSFLEFQKNSKKQKDPKLIVTNSITCTDVPDSLIVKSVAKEYFDQFGETIKVSIRPRKKIITVYYADHEDSKKAYKKAGEFLKHRFHVEWTASDRPKTKPVKKESIKKRISSFLNIDDDVKEELEALKGLEYNIPDSQNLKTLNMLAKARVKRAMTVANKDAPKRLPLAPKSSLLKTSVLKPLKSLSQTVKSTPKVQPLVDDTKLKSISLVSIEELQKQVCRQGFASEEKFKILDARDKLMRLKQNKQTNLATAKVTKGTCPDMCPEKERYMREFQRQLASYEQVEVGSADYRINHAVTVKQYSRSSADQEEPMAHDLRPVKSLKMTMSYLLHEIADLCDNEEANLTEWYHYLWDRTRSIRKDITQQELCCVETVELVEQCARFHILASERLCAEETSVFDPKINSENLTKCLQSLKYMYHDLREHGIICQNEAEFRAYIVLLNLNNDTFISELSTLTPEVQNSPEIKFALSVYSALALHNYSRFFKLVRKTTYLNGCILLRYFNQVRVKALSIMVKAYCRASSTTEYPLYELIDILGFEDEDEAYDLCSRIGLKCDRDSLFIKLKRENFHMPDGTLEQGRACDLVLSKRNNINQPVGHCIAGGFWPEKIYKDHKPHSSFDNNGYLMKTAYNAQDQGVDPYEFMDDDKDIQFSENEVIDKNEVKEKKNNLLLTAKTAVISGLSSKLSQTAKMQTATAVLGSSTIQRVSQNVTSEVSESKFGITPSSESQSFGKPVKASPFLLQKPVSSAPNDSPFNKPATENIFLKAPSKPSIFKPLAGIGSASEETISVFGVVSSSNEKQGMKRRLEDSHSSEEAAQKKKLLEQEKLEKERRALEAEKQAAMEKKLRIELLHKLAVKDCEKIQNEVIYEICSTVVQVEMDRLALMNNLSSKIFYDLVNELCESLLDEQLFIQDMLIEVSRRIKDKICRKYWKLWKLNVDKKRIRRRQALDNTPVWLQRESFEETARKMYRPNIKLAIKHAREQRRKSSGSEDTKESPKRTPIEFIISVGLKENMNIKDELRSHDFWKIAISWPSVENRLTIWRHKRFIDQYFMPSDPTCNPIIIQHKPITPEYLTICIRQFEDLSFNNSLVGTEAILLICFADENTKVIERRLTKAIMSREKLPPIPLVVLIFGDETNVPNSVEISPLVRKMFNSGQIAEYSILKESSTDENVVLKVLQSALLWLAINRSSPVPLKMDYLNRIFNDCLIDELWLRIHNSLNSNPKLSKSLMDPNFVINLHNEAVNHMIDIMLDPESLNYTDFSPEMKPYLNRKPVYPCNYEYFDTVWKDPEYRAELESVMSGFIFPSWKFNWPIHDMLELHDSIASYCRLIVPGESSTIAQDVMSNLYFISESCQDDENVNRESICRLDCFSEILVHIVSKKIAKLPSNVRAVYNKNHMTHFRTLPWWFKSNALNDYLAGQEEEEAYESADENDTLTLCQAEISEVSEINQSCSDFDINLDELERTCHEMDVDRPVSMIEEEGRKYTTDLLNKTQELELKLKEQSIRNEELESQLKQALQDGEIKNLFKIS